MARYLSKYNCKYERMEADLPFRIRLTVSVSPTNQTERAMMVRVTSVPARETCLWILHRDGRAEGDGYRTNSLGDSDYSRSGARETAQVHAPASASTLSRCHGAAAWPTLTFALAPRSRDSFRETEFLLS